MKHLTAPYWLTFLASIATPLAAESPVMLKDAALLKQPDPQIALKIETTSVAKNGHAETTGTHGQQDQSIEITRTRLMHRTMVPDALGGEVTYRFYQDRIVTALNGKPEARSAPLDGKTAKGLKNGAGNWTFSLDGQMATGDAVTDLDLLGAFENRQWLPGRVVRVGESWNFSPAFIRRSLQEDVPNAQVIGMMKLREIATTRDGSRQAIIDCVIRGGGRTEPTPGTVAQAETGLAGNLTVNLDDPAKMKLYLSGTLQTGAQNSRETTKVTLPLTLQLTTTRLDPGQR